MPLITGLALGLVWLIDTLWERIRSTLWERIRRRHDVVIVPLRQTTAPSPPTPPPTSSEQPQRAVTHELHRRRAEEQAITVLKRSIDIEHDPQRWQQACLPAHGSCPDCPQPEPRFYEPWFTYADQ